MTTDTASDRLIQRLQSPGGFLALVVLIALSMSLPFVAMPWRIAAAVVVLALVGVVLAWLMRKSPT